MNKGQYSKEGKSRSDLLKKTQTSIEKKEKIGNARNVAWETITSMDDLCDVRVHPNEKKKLQSI